MTLSQNIIDLKVEKRCPPPHKKTLKLLDATTNIFSGGTMEIHPLLYELDKKDSERYMNACKDDLMDFLDNLCLSNTLALQVLEEVRISLES